MSTLYAKEDVSGCHIAGAVAAAALHDLFVNTFSMAAFPAVQVDKLDEKNFTISMHVQTKTGLATQSFVLPRAEAFEAARHFKKTQRHMQNLMERVMEANSKLERAYRDAKR